MVTRGPSPLSPPPTNALSKVSKSCSACSSSEAIISPPGPGATTMGARRTGAGGSDAAGDSAGSVNDSDSLGAAGSAIASAARKTLARPARGTLVALSEVGSDGTDGEPPSGAVCSSFQILRSSMIPGGVAGNPPGTGSSFRMLGITAEGVTMRIWLSAWSTGQISRSRSRATVTCCPESGSIRTLPPPAMLAPMPPFSPSFSSSERICEICPPLPRTINCRDVISASTVGALVPSAANSLPMARTANCGSTVRSWKTSIRCASRSIWSSVARIVACSSARAMAIRLPVFGSIARRTPGLPTSRVCITLSTPSGSAGLTS